MAESSNRFHALIENGPDAISLLNSEGEILYASASTAKVLGYEPQELLGRNGLELLHPSDRERSARALRSVLAQPQSHDRVQARVRRKDGHWVWVESTTSNLLDEPAVNAILVSHREIAERRAEEEEKRRVSEDLLRSNTRLAAFAYTVAHDLREPLRTISAFTQLLVRRAKLEDSDKEIGRFVVEGVQRMSTLLEHLLSSATHDLTESLHPLELDHAVAQAMQNLREAIASSGAVVSIEPLPAVQGNECDLVRLFQNLIGNAIKYRSSAAVEIHIAAERCGPEWVIRIRDNGIGISPEHHRRVFGLLTRLHGDEIAGTGIGLAVCRKIVEGLGGAIWVESALQAGSTFCFTIPAASQASAASETDSEIARAATSS